MFEDGCSSLGAGVSGVSGRARSGWVHGVWRELRNGSLASERRRQQRRLGEHYRGDGVARWLGECGRLERWWHEQRLLRSNSARGLGANVRTARGADARRMQRRAARYGHESVRCARHTGQSGM
jgi:hypothetical protein